MVLATLDHRVSLTKKPTSVWGVTSAVRTILQITIVVMLACYAHDGQASSFRIRQTLLATDWSRQELKQLIESFGPDEQDVNLQKLLSIPPQQLISRLLQFRKGKINSAAFQVRVTFLLCRLDYEYQHNRKLIRSNLSRAHRANADTTISLIGALIARGDRSLLSDVFSACEWSDGAASEAISDVFLEETSKHLSAFVRTLKLRTTKVRLGVYRFFNSAWTKDQLSSLKKSLDEMPQTAELRSIRTEMLQALNK